MSIDNDIIRSWPSPNYTNPESLARVCRISLKVAIVLNSLMLILRIYTRAVLLKRLGWEDTLMLIAIGLGCISIHLGFKAIENNMGVHMWDFPQDPSIASKALFAMFSTEVIYYPAMAFVKLSVLRSFLRICPTVAFCRRVYAVGAIIAIHAVVATLTLVLQCNPVQGYWAYGYARPASVKCLPPLPMHMTVGGINILTELMVVALPMPLLIKARLPRRHKAALATLFILGGSVTVFTVVKLWIVYKAIVLTYDYTWDGAIALVMASVECSVAVVGASLPALASLLRRMKPTKQEDHALGSVGYAGPNHEQRIRDSETGVIGKLGVLQSATDLTLPNSTAGNQAEDDMTTARSDTLNAPPSALVKEGAFGDETGPFSFASTAPITYPVVCSPAPKATWWARLWRRNPLRAERSAGYTSTETLHIEEQRSCRNHLNRHN